MGEFKFITLRDEPTLKEDASMFFHLKWGVDQEEYLKCMDDYLSGKTEYGWYLCLYKNQIVGGLGVIDNDFHNRKDLFPNICAVYTKEEFRNKKIAGTLLLMVVNDLKNKNISPVYLVTDHIGFYEKYGFEYYCSVRCFGEDHDSRLYVHY